jgi:hypothetical protein
VLGWFSAAARPKGREIEELVLEDYETRISFLRLSRKFREE